MDIKVGQVYKDNEGNEYSITRVFEDRNAIYLSCPQQSSDDMLTLLSGFKMAIDQGIFAPLADLQGCQHERKTYTGFTDTFDYCTKCDVRL